MTREQQYALMALRERGYVFVQAARMQGSDVIACVQRKMRDGIMWLQVSPDGRYRLAGWRYDKSTREAVV